MCRLDSYGNIITHTLTHAYLSIPRSLTHKCIQGVTNVSIAFKRQENEETEEEL